MSEKKSQVDTKIIKFLAKLRLFNDEKRSRSLCAMLIFCILFRIFQNIYKLLKTKLCHKPPLDSFIK